MLARAATGPTNRARDLDLRQMSECGAPGTVAGMDERSTARSALRAAGFGCLMVAAGLAGYVAWLLWGTGLETARAQEELRESAAPSFVHPTPPSPDERYLPGEAYASIAIPRSTSTSSSWRAPTT